MKKLRTRAQFEHRLIVLPFLLFTARDLSSKTQPPTTVTKVNNYC